MCVLVTYLTININITERQKEQQNGMKQKKEKTTPADSTLISKRLTLLGANTRICPLPVCRAPAFFRLFTRAYVGNIALH